VVSFGGLFFGIEAVELPTECAELREAEKNVSPAFIASHAGVSSVAKVCAPSLAKRFC